MRLWVEGCWVDREYGEVQKVTRGYRPPQLKQVAGPQGNGHLFLLLITILESF